MILSRRFALRPTPTQAAAMGRAAGASRWAYNFAVARQREALDCREKLPTAIDLHRELNRLKQIPAEGGGVPWMYEVSKSAPQEALRDAEAAWKRCFKGLARRPRFHHRSDGGHFRLTGSIQIDSGRVRLPRIGWVCVMPGERKWAPDGKHKSVSITEVAGWWFASVHVEVEEAPADDTRPVVGIDVGVRDLIHFSDGTPPIENPKALAQEQKRLRRSRLAIARKRRAADKRLGQWKKGERRVESNRLRRERRKAARLANRVANIRKDALHKATTVIAKRYSVVAVEGLRVKNMTARRRGKGRAAKAGLNRAILDSGMGQVRRLLAYKMPLWGGRLIQVPATYTSQTCSRCGPKVRNDPGSSKTYKCETCGVVLDRDFNASLNILNVAASWPETENARGAGLSPPTFGSAATSDDPRIGAVA